MARALKVYRLTIGFHDAYVAAPSQKAAVEAWGSDKDVFARGQAELVADPALTEEPLARPGTVIKRLRASAAEQVAALDREASPATRRRSRPSAEPEPKPKAKLKPPPKPKPRPSRARLDSAEQALAEADARHRAALETLAEREAALARERAGLEALQEKERERLESRRGREAAAYEQTLQRWRAS
jgi:hypothetical protein